MKVKIHNTSNLPMVDYENLLNLQGDLKTMTPENESKILNSFEKKGFILPFVVWEDKSGKLWTLDGNGRLKVMRKTGVVNQDGDTKFPILKVHAKSKKDAAEVILLISSEFHKKTEGGLASFAEKFKINTDWISLNTAFDVNFTSTMATSAAPPEDAWRKSLLTDMYKDNNEKKKAVAEIDEEMKNEKEIADAKAKKEESSEGVKSGDRYSEFSLVMLHDYKIRIFQTLSAIKMKNDLENNTDALMYLVQYYDDKESK